MKSFETLVGKTTKAAIRNDRQIKQVISQIVPASSMPHILFCRNEGGRLRITVDGAAWVSRLRFMERQIIDVLRAQRYDTHTVSFHVTPAEIPVVRKTVRAPRKSLSGSVRLEDTANSFKGAGDDRLRQELLQLARTLRSKG